MHQTGLVSSHFSANVETKPTRKMLDGREHLVFPVVAAKVGVMNDKFYPEEELKPWAHTWNASPIPIRHPEGARSARDPVIQESLIVGTVYNARFNDGSLIVDMWVDIAKAEKLGFGSVVNRLETGEVMEVSTGLFFEREDTAGMFNNKSYSSVVRKIRPDHIALLPDQVGACSVKDGCGTMLTNCECADKPVEEEKPCRCSEKETGFKEKAFNFLRGIIGYTTNESSHRAIEEQLREYVSKKIHTDSPDSENTFVWVVDVFDTYFIFSIEKNGETLFYSVNYINRDGRVEVIPVFQEVTRETKYIPIMGKGEDNMTINTDEEQPKEEAPKEEVPKEEAPKEEAPKEEAPKEEAPDAGKDPLDAIEDNELKVYLKNAANTFKAESEAQRVFVAQNASLSKEELDKLSPSTVSKIYNSLKGQEAQPASYQGNGSAPLEAKNNQNRTQVSASLSDICK